MNKLPPFIALKKYCALLTEASDCSESLVRT